METGKTLLGDKNRESTQHIKNYGNLQYNHWTLSYCFIRENMLGSQQGELNKVLCLLPLFRA